MVSFWSKLAAAAVAFSTFTTAQPLHESKRQVNAAVSPIADPVQVDAIGTYMRTTVLEDGTILAGYKTIEGDEQILRTARSTDNGGSWQRAGIVDRGPSATREIDNAFPLQIPGGPVLMSFRNHDKDAGGPNGYRTYRISLCVSDDGGDTWSFLSQIDERQATDLKNGLWEPLLRIDRGGAIQAYYSAENAGDDQDNLMKASTDGGATWGDIITVSGAGITSRDGMIGVAEVGNGDLMCVFENTATGPFSVDYVLSSDDGYSWDRRARIYTAVNNLEAGSPQIINVGGTLVVSFMSNEAGSGPGVDGGEFKVVTSTDGGATWSDDIVISGLGSHWPGMHVLDDSTFLALYSADGQGLVSRKHEV